MKVLTLKLFSWRILKIHVVSSVILRLYHGPDLYFAAKLIWRVIQAVKTSKLNREGE